MAVRQGLIAVLIVATCALSARFGRARRAAGGRVSARDVVLVMGVAWCAAWLVILLPDLYLIARREPLSETVPTLLFVVALAAAPLVLFLAAARLPGLIAGARPGRKEDARHPLG